MENKCDDLYNGDIYPFHQPNETYKKNTRTNTRACVYNYRDVIRITSISHKIIKDG